MFNHQFNIVSGRSSWSCRICLNIPVFGRHETLPSFISYGGDQYIEKSESYVYGAPELMNLALDGASFPPLKLINYGFRPTADLHEYTLRRQEFLKSGLSANI